MSDTWDEKSIPTQEQYETALRKLEVMRCVQQSQIIIGQAAEDFKKGDTVILKDNRWYLWNGRDKHLHEDNDGSFLSYKSRSPAG